MYAQLSDIHPDGASTRVYGLMNLTHLEGHDKVVYLEEGKTYKAKSTVGCVDITSRKDTESDFLLQNSFWPMIWPSPELATLKLDLSTAKFALPMFSGKDAEGPNMEARCAPLTR